jgi:fructose-specific component phosphotransferase system IIB-like protein
MPNNTSLADLLTEVAKYAPHYIIDEEQDGNIVIILNKQLVNGYLEEFPQEEEEDA